MRSPTRLSRSRLGLRESPSSTVGIATTFTMQRLAAQPSQKTRMSISRGRNRVTTLSLYSFADACLPFEQIAAPKVSIRPDTGDKRSHRPRHWLRYRRQPAAPLFTMADWAASSHSARHDHHDALDEAAGNHNRPFHAAAAATDYRMAGDRHDGCHCRHDGRVVAQLIGPAASNVSCRAFRLARRAICVAA